MLMEWPLSLPSLPLILPPHRPQATQIASLPCPQATPPSLSAIPFLPAIGSDA